MADGGGGCLRPSPSGYTPATELLAKRRTEENRSTRKRDKCRRNSTVCCVPWPDHVHDSARPLSTNQ